MTISATMDWLRGAEYWELQSRGITLTHLVAEAERIKHTPREWIDYLGQQIRLLRAEFKMRGILCP